MLEIVFLKIELQK